MKDSKQNNNLSYAGGCLILIVIYIVLGTLANNLNAFIASIPIPIALFLIWFFFYVYDR